MAESWPGDLVTLFDAAKAVGLPLGTIRDWVKLGQLAGYRLPGAQAQLVSLSAVKHLKRRAALDDSRSPGTGAGSPP